MAIKLSDLDRDPVTNTMPIQSALRWLQTLIDSPAVAWTPQQRQACQEAVALARETLTTEVSIVEKEGGGYALDFKRITIDKAH